MKRYLLLRDNQEKGPFTWEELKDLGLKPNDLIWINGESTRWYHPIEIQSLFPREIECLDPKKELEYASFNAFAPQRLNEYPVLPNTTDSFHNFQIEEPDQESSRSGTKSCSMASNYRTNKSAALGAYGVWITILVMLLGSTVWMFQIAIDVFKGKGLTQSNLTRVASPIKPLPEGVSPSRDEDNIYQNALTREIVPVDTILNKEPVKKLPGIRELKKYVQIEASDFKVNVLGGINELKLTVRNNSSHILEKVVLQLDYLKPNGEMVQTEKYTYFSISPHDSKTLDIPPSKKGVNIKYKIVDAKPREYKLTLVQA
jgi:hypothetical protein